MILQGSRNSLTGRRFLEPAPSPSVNKNFMRVVDKKTPGASNARRSVESNSVTNFNKFRQMSLRGTQSERKKSVVTKPATATRPYSPTYDDLISTANAASAKHVASVRKLGAPRQKPSTAAGGPPLKATLPVKEMVKTTPGNITIRHFVAKVAVKFSSLLSLNKYNFIHQPLQSRAPFFAKKKKEKIAG